MSRVRDILQAIEAASGVPSDAAENGSSSTPARVRLADFAPVSQTNAHGQSALIFGFVFAAFGALPLLVHERFLVPVYARWESVREDPFGASIGVDQHEDM